MSEAEAGRSERELIQALSGLREEPYGAARSARTEELVDEAERLGYERALVLALFELLTAYEYGAETRKGPVLFSRILSLYAERPELFDDWAARRVFWCFKWISSSLLEIPDVPLATIEGWLAQMQERYRAAGKPLQAVRTSRYKLAAHTGVGLDAAYELWATRPRDEFSDCEACEARLRGDHWARQGQDERALAEWTPVLEGRLSCAEEPAATTARALLPLLRLGRTDEAVSLHRSGYRATKGKVSMDAEVARHLEFLALTGNGARGLELLAENRYRFDSTAAPETRLSFLSGVRILMARLVAEGNAEAPVPAPGGAASTAARVLAEVTAQTDELARRFDQRNGTDYQTSLLHAACAMEPLTARPLELGLHSTPLPVAAAPVLASAPIPTDFATLLAEAREALRLSRPEERRLWEAVAERADEADLDDVLRAELTDREAFRLLPAKQWVEAEALLRRAGDLFEQAGRPGAATSRRSRAAWCAFQHAADLGEPPSWAEFDALLQTAQAQRDAGTIDADEFCIVRHSRASAALRLLTGRTIEGEDGSEDGPAPVGRPEELARFQREADELYRVALELGVLWRAAIARSLTAVALESAGQLDQALARMAEAVELAERDEHPWSLPALLAQHGHLLGRLRRPEAASAALRRALALAAEWPDPRLDETGILMELAWNRMELHDAAGAIGPLTTAATRFDRRGQAEAGTMARAMLGRSLMHADRPADAIAVFESVLEEETEARLAQGERAQLRLDLGRCLLRTGEPRQAAEVFVRLADLVEDWPEHRVRTMVAAELAGALFAAGMPDQAETALTRALDLHEQAPDPNAATAALRAAAGSLLERVRRPDQSADRDGPARVTRALAYLDRADAVAEAAEEQPGGFLRWPARAQAADLRTQLLGAAGRNEEALAATLDAALAWELGGPQTIGNWAEAVRIAAILEGVRLGRREQAVARLEPAVERCRQAGYDQGVQSLTQLVRNLSER